MSSITASEVLTQPARTLSRRDLLVLWQNPESRAIDAVGRLSFDGNVYTFCYTRRSAEVEGFRPLPGLRDTSHVYHSSFLFPLFAQRVMDPSRPGYERYLSRLGLTPDESSPWEQIVRSGGVREGDTLQFLPLPCVDGGRASATFLAHGVRWVSRKELQVAAGPITVSGTRQESALADLQPGSVLGLLPEPGNPASADAILITANDVPVGYVPEVLSAAVGRLGEAARVRVLRVNGPDAPPHLRLVVALEASVDDDFRFDPGHAWDPAVSEG
ncbi:hypothetical protein [Cellulomonas sp. Y8]|uniref:hypothetical protein n=1 Tax=Cellulomonas sp. Y8 TaxID=2591145 RepID=UPI0011CC84B2|nr:hypothetical protein [Cellulomonas sp. Y8]